MIGANGFRAKEATANYKRRIRKLVPDEVRAARFANLHGNDESEVDVEVEAVEPAAAPEAETVEAFCAGAIPDEVPADEAGETADEAADEAGDEDGEDAGDEAGEGDADAAPAEGDTAQKKKAGKAKKKAAK